MKTVILVGLALSLLVSNSHSFAQGTEVAPGVLMIGTIQSADIAESSGIAPSRRGKGLFWTHNDSGADTLYALTPAGEVTGSYKLKDTELQNWEDIVSAPGRIYAADIGNNDANRNSVNIYAFPEPNPRRSGEVKPLRAWKIDYPDDPFDAESFFLSKGYGYVIEKESGNAHVFRFKLNGRGTDRTLEEQCELNLDAPAAGADITSDNKRLAVITSAGAYLFALPGKVPASGTLEPALFVPFSLDRMEGCAFTRDGLIVTAESGEILLFTDPQFRLKSGAKILP
jgi:hypothetical protein